MSLLRTHSYRGYAIQSLRNVVVSSPSIFWVQRGQKQLSAGVVADELQLLLVPARSRLTFANQPYQGEFLAQQICLLAAPKPALLQLSDQQQFQPPLVALSASAQHLCGLSLHPHSHAMQRQLLGLWHQFLAEHGALRYLYSAATASVSEQLQRWFNADPGADHQLDAAAKRLAMSRATLIRKLHAEGTTFRQLLLDCRMNHALALMQQGQAAVMVAMACGYDSDSRFRQRFVEHFGVTPQAYQRTLQPPR